jgi:hypothetical protein
MTASEAFEEWKSQALPSANNAAAFRAGWDAAVQQNASVGALLSEIAKMDIKHGVFRVFVNAYDHRTGYMAVADLRACNDGLACDGDTPEEALKGLKALLEQAYGKCPHCGQYKDGRDAA